MVVALDHRGHRAEPAHGVSIKIPHRIADRVIVRIDDVIAVILVAGKVDLAHRRNRNRVDKDLRVEAVIDASAILTTDFHTTSAILAARMFARWSQENFFRYGRLSYGLDRLADYSTEEITDPIMLVNPAYRQLDSQVHSANARLSRLLAQFGALNFELTIEPEQMVPFVTQKSALHEQIEGLKADVGSWLQPIQNCLSSRQRFNVRCQSGAAILDGCSPTSPWP